ncbi:MAG: response regulator transcription factor [Bacteroidetes bacterium]|nr:response regulator transcription factor [Bacteroidota bacterium]
MKEKKEILRPVPWSEFNTRFAPEGTREVENPELLFAETIKYVEAYSPGKYFWFIANLVKGITVSCGGMIERTVALKPNQLFNKSPEALFNIIHPEDQGKMFAFSNYWARFYLGVPVEKRSGLRPTIYIRMKNTQQLYSWFMVQYISHLFDHSGNLVYAFTLSTDISHIKTEGEAMMSILDIENETCHLFYCSEAQQVTESKENVQGITVREMEVLKFLSTGLSSKQIARELGLSTKTVDNHRQNMLRKTNTKNTGELVAFGINMGFI